MWYSIFLVKYWHRHAWVLLRALGGALRAVALVVALVAMASLMCGNGRVISLAPLPGAPGSVVLDLSCDEMAVEL